MSQVTPILENLWRVVVDFVALLQSIFALGVSHVLLIAWIAWWLLGVNWEKTWHYLARGAWAPVVLLMLVAALVWSRLEPGTHSFLGVPIGNFWWQLGAIGLIAAVTLLCGWLQGLFHWTPTEIDLSPPAHAEHHGHH
ncbi:MAG: hypothetical protein HY040_06415 [Planctomycetes bacterium]|nr:hypothetical protein [Planctomycetota bacterium]